VEIKVGRGDSTQTTVQPGIQGEGVESRVVPHKDWCLERVSSRGPTAHEDDKLCHTFQYASYHFSLPISDISTLTATRDGRSLIAIGCVEGLWIGDALGPQCEYSPYVQPVWSLTRYRAAFHRILPLQMIRQCAVLEEFGIILILTHNVCLFRPTQSSYPNVTPLQDLCAYDLESCVPTSMDPQTCHPPQKLNRGGDVPFFRVGMFDGRAHVIFPRKHVR